MSARRRGWKSPGNINDNDDGDNTSPTDDEPSFSHGCRADYLDTHSRESAVARFIRRPGGVYAWEAAGHKSRYTWHLQRVH